MGAPGKDTVTRLNINSRPISSFQKGTWPGWGSQAYTEFLLRGTVNTKKSLEASWPTPLPVTSQGGGSPAHFLPVSISIP